jgi:hypothetical protein
MNYYNIPQGTEKVDYQERKKIIISFYANWLQANTTRHIYNKSLNDFIEVRYLSINETSGKAVVYHHRNKKRLKTRGESHS